MSQKRAASFEVNDWVVYPAHGVGRLVAIETNEYAGIRLDVYVITFEHERMTLRVPIHSAARVKLRKVTSPEDIKRAVTIFGSKAKIKRGMWSKRAREYEDKIHSGDLLSAAEVARDLYREPSVDPASYSEQSLYRDAITRLIREASTVWDIDEQSAAARISNLSKKTVTVPGSDTPKIAPLKGAIDSPLHVKKHL